MLAVYYAADEDGSRGSEELAASDSAAADELIELSLSEPEAESPRPGSLRDRLQSTNEANRESMLWRTIQEQGFECPAISSSGAIGQGGATWRANCGSGRIYAVHVDEFDALAVEPAAYGDVDPSMLQVPVIEATEGVRGRTLELRDRQAPQQ